MLRLHHSSGTAGAEAGLAPTRNNVPIASWTAQGGKETQLACRSCRSSGGRWHAQRRGIQRPALDRRVPARQCHATDDCGAMAASCGEMAEGSAHLLEDGSHFAAFYGEV